MFIWRFPAHSVQVCVPLVGIDVNKVIFHHQIFKDRYRLKLQPVPLTLTRLSDLGSCTKGYPSQVKRHSLPFQVIVTFKHQLLFLSIFLYIKRIEFVVLFLESTNYKLQTWCKKLYEEDH